MEPLLRLVVQPPTSDCKLNRRYCRGERRLTHKKQPSGKHATVMCQLWCAQSWHTNRSQLQPSAVGDPPHRQGRGRPVVSLPFFFLMKHLFAAEQRRESDWISLELQFGEQGMVTSPISGGWKWESSKMEVHWILGAELSCYWSTACWRLREHLQTHKNH